MKKRVSVFFTFTLMCIPFLSWAETDVAVIPVHYRNGSQLLPVIESMLSKEGRVTYDARSSQMVVIDRPEVIARARAVVRRLDQPVQQARIRVRFQAAESMQRRRAGTDGRISGDGREIRIGSPGKKDGIRIQAENSSVQRNRDASYALQVSSGSPAYIRTGADVPFREHWRGMCRRYRACSGSVTFKSVETGFEVIPTIRGDHAFLQIVPRMSDMHGGMIRFAEAATELTVPLGKWVTIGGSGHESSDALQAVLESGGKSGQDALVISLIVEAL